MSFIKLKISIILLFVYAVCNINAHAGNKILVINSYSSDYQWSNSIVDEINSTLKKNFSGMELNIEYLSSERFSEPVVWVERINMLMANYTTELPAAIVIISDEAWMSYRASNNQRFADIPMFLCAVKPHSITIERYVEKHNQLTLEDYSSTKEEMLKYNATAVIREMNIDGYMSLIDQLMPKTDSYTLITDNRFYGIYTKLLFEQHHKLSQSKKRIEYIDARFTTTDQMLSRLTEISPNSGLILTSWLTGQCGYEYSKQYTYKRMSTLLKTPIFITNDIGINSNYFMGGYFHDSQFWGAKTGNMLMKGLSGMSPHDIKPETYIDTQCHINWTVLNRFDMNPDDLPVQTKYINRIESIFVKYATEMTIGVLIFIVIIIGFTYSIQSNLKLKRAQKLASLAINEAYESNRHLIATQENLKTALINAEAADRLKSAFINNMDHEIRTPLNSIVGFSSIITSLGDKEEIDEAAKQISESSEKLLSVIKGILDLSQLEAGTAVFEYTRVNIDGIFEDLINVSQLRCRDGVVVRFRPPEQSLSLIIEPNRVTQILTNIIHNAIKFTLDGFIELGYFIFDEQWVEFYVQDTGIGIEQSEVDKIFNRFYKTNTHVPGAGLGLSIAKEIIEIMDGQYGLSSQPGVGSRFWFRLKIT